MSTVHLQHEDGGAPPFAGEVTDILNLALATDSLTAPSEAAKKLDNLLSKNTEDNGPSGSYLWWFWDLVHGLAAQIPHDSPAQDQLVAVIKALHDLPVKRVKLSEGWGADGDEVEVWNKLPMFANTFREKLDEENTKATREDEKRQRRVNLEAYAARVAGLGLVPFEMYAIWALVDALEGTMTPIRGAPDEVNPDPTAVEHISYKVKSAAAWMIHAGHRLYGRDEVVDGATAGPLWRLDKKEAIKLRRKLRGTDGLCLERWQLWKERFAVVRDRDGLDEDARKEAGNAFAVMEKIETS